MRIAIVGALLLVAGLIWWMTLDPVETVLRCDLRDGSFVVLEDEPRGEWFEFEGERIPVAEIESCSEMTVTPPRTLRQ